MQTHSDSDTMTTIISVVLGPSTLAYDEPRLSDRATLSMSKVCFSFDTLTFFPRNNTETRVHSLFSPSHGVVEAHLAAFGVLLHSSLISPSIHTRRTDSPQFRAK